MKYLEEISRFRPEEESSLSMELDTDIEDDNLLIAGNIAVLPEEIAGTFPIPALSFSLPSSADVVLPETNHLSVV